MFWTQTRGQLSNHFYECEDEELRSHLLLLPSKIKPHSARHEEIDFGIDGKELI